MTDKPSKQLEQPVRKKRAPVVFNHSGSEYGNPISTTPLPKREKSDGNNGNRLAAEYFVAAELSRRGFAVTLNNSRFKNIDLFVFKNNKAIPVQVLTVKNLKSTGWPLAKNDLLDKIVYVLVNLNDYNTPEYYILTGKEAGENFKKTGAKGFITLTPAKKVISKNMWTKIAEVDTRNL